MKKYKYSVGYFDCYGWKYFSNLKGAKKIL